MITQAQPDKSAVADDSHAELASAPAVPAGDSAHWALLAGVRFFLATCVAFTHIATVTPERWTWLARYPFGALGGFYAVLGFFVISGYSIAASLERSPSGFYARRFFRIAPVYWACFFLSLLPWHLAHSAFVYFPNGNPLRNTLDSSHGITKCIMNALFLQGFASEPTSGFGQSWSLSCEIVYYIAAPLIARLPSRAVLGIAALSAAAYLYHGYNIALPFSIETRGWATVALAWAWLLGFWLRRVRQSESAWGWFALTLLTLASVDPNDYSAYGAISCAAVALALSPRAAAWARKELTPILKRGLVWLGEISYPLYLSHFAVILLLGFIIHPTTELKADGDYLFYAAAIAAATLIYYAIDLPARKLGKLLEGRRAVSESGDVNR